MLMLAVSGGASFGQAVPAAAVPPAASAPLTTASSLLQPSLAVVQTTLNGLKTEKWKKGSVREEAEGNVASLLKDLQANLPGLLTAADAAPGELSKAIPLVKHLDAFYDVLLRVEEASRVVGPADQVGDLQQAMLKLNQARLALDDHLAADAAAQEKQVGDLQAALKTARAAAVPQVVAAAVPCKPVVPAKKKAAVKKPAAAAPATTTPGATTTKPSSAPAKPASGQPSGQKTP